MEGISAQHVADSFIEQYYVVLNKSPESVHKFYKESSVLSWPEPDGSVTPVTTSSGINDKVVSSDYTKSFVEIQTVDAQDSFEGGVIVGVTGLLTGKDNAKKNFFQTFFLAKQDNGYFVLNDILHIFDISGSITNPILHKDDINDQTAHSMQNSVPPCTIDHTASTKTKDAVENGIVEEVVDISVSNDTVGTVVASTLSTDSLENSSSIPEPTSDIKGGNQEMNQLESTQGKDPVENGSVEEVVDLSFSNDTAATVAASTSSVDSLENSCSVPIPASDIKVDAQEKANIVSSNTKEAVENANIKDEVDTSVSQDTSAMVAPQKISYASVVAKGRTGTSPKTASFPLKADNRAVSPPTAKLLTAPSNADNQAIAPQTVKVSPAIIAGESKTTTPNNIAYKAPPSTSNDDSKLAARDNGAINSNGHVEGAATGIYIGRLPIDIDKQGILKVVTKFGPVRNNLDSIQICRHEDGFCCGFVEFESADSARRAVEARHINFGEKESYISYKRSSYRGNNGIRRSPSNGGLQSRDFGKRENGQVRDNKRFPNKHRSGDNKGQA